MVSTTVDVEVFGREKMSFLFSPDKRASALTSAMLMPEIANLLNLQAPSLQLFALYHGTLLCPKKVFKPADVVSGSDSLCFKKRSFNIELEKRLLQKDDQALHLIFEEARARVYAGDIELSAAEKADLEALDDPSFPTETQFVGYLIKNCRERYQTVRFRDCRLGGRGAGDIPAGVVVTALYAEDYLRLVAPRDGPIFQSSWNRVMSWSASEANSTVSFQLCDGEGSSQQTVELQSDQLNLMVACALQLCLYLVETRGDPSKPSANPKVAIGRLVNPLFEEFSRTVFPKPNFKKF